MSTTASDYGSAHGYDSTLTVEDYTQLRITRSSMMGHRTQLQEDLDRKELIRIEAVVQKNLQRASLPMLMKQDSIADNDADLNDIELIVLQQYLFRI